MTTKSTVLLPWRLRCATPSLLNHVGMVTTVEFLSMVAGSWEWVGYLATARPTYLSQFWCPTIVFTRFNVSVLRFDIFCSFIHSSSCVSYSSSIICLSFIIVIIAIAINTRIITARVLARYFVVNRKVRVYALWNWLSPGVHISLTKLFDLAKFWT